MPFTDSLPAQVYLLACDLGTDKLSAWPWLDYLVQGAALGELALGGYLTGGEGEGGLRQQPGRWPTEPLLSEVLRTVEGRSWRQALRHGTPTLMATRDRLVRDGVLVLRGHRTAVLAKAPVQRLQDQARGILLSGEGVTAEQAAPVVLAAVAPLTIIASRRQWRLREDRVAQLTRLAAREAPTFGQMVAQMRKGRGR